MQPRLHLVKFLEESQISKEEKVSVYFVESRGFKVTYKKLSGRSDLGIVSQLILIPHTKSGCVVESRMYLATPNLSTGIAVW